jgi:N-acyl-D-aspartate/D-glutamate deacylase
VKVLAAFASSEAGKTFARIEQHYGRDPAASLEDDVLAHNLRAALLLTLNREDRPEPDPIAKTREAGAAIRRRMSGRD